MAKVKVKKVFVYDKKGKAKRSECQEKIQDFVKSDARICVIKFTIGEGYKNVHSADVAAHRMINTSGENLKAHMRGELIFLEKVL
jgi:hypothetical protein